MSLWSLNLIFLTVLLGTHIINSMRGGFLSRTPFPRSTQRARFNLAFQVWLDAGPSATQRLILYTEANGWDVYCLAVSIWQDPFGVYHVW